MSKADKIIVGISVGDINGIGIEVILKTFEDNRMLEFCTPIVFASNRVFSAHKKTLNNTTPIYGLNSLKNLTNNRVNVLNIWKEDVKIELGKPTKVAGKYALKSLQEALKSLKNNEINLLVTAPINKDNIQSEEFDFSGHTEYLSSEFGGESLMILMTENLRIGLITGHIPLSKVAESITQELIIKKVNIMYKSLKQDFCIQKPKIAVLGLNPHCGDNGIIGTEDDEIVRPAIQKIKETGKLVFGPYATDGFFGSKTYKQFDGVLAMYHDQGLAPFKALSFGEGVNFTAGLPIVRTSPDHGTGYDIAGKNTAKPNSFKKALFTALEIYRNREEFIELTANKLV